MRRNGIHHNSVRLDEELDELVKNEMSAWTKEQLQSSNKPVEKKRKLDDEHRR